MKQEAREANAEMKQEAREAGNAAERAGDRVAQETKDATRSVGATLDAAAQTMQIKTALIDADNLDANNIDVDTNAATKTVTLQGPCGNGVAEGCRRAHRKGEGSGLSRRQQPRDQVRSRGSRRVRGSRGAIPRSLRPYDPHDLCLRRCREYLRRDFVQEFSPHNPRMRAGPRLVRVLDAR